MEHRTHSARTVLLLALINIFLSAFVPLGAVLIRRPLSGADNFIIGTVLFCAGSLLEILYYLAQLRERAAREDAVWDSHTDIDAKLSSIRKSIRSLESGIDPHHDIFIQYYRSRVVSLEADARQTARSRELRVDSQNLDLSAPLLDSFVGTETDIIRIVHFLLENDALFNVHEAQWFYRVFDAVNRRKVVAVHRLLVFQDRAELQDPRSIRLMRFLRNAEHFDYRLISAENFERLAKSFRLFGEFADFGIYGERYLFRGLLYAEKDFVGLYSRDLQSIRKYVAFFDFCWGSPTSRRLDGQTTAEPIGIEELFEPSIEP
jgi:hypothetical protein